MVVAGNFEISISFRIVLCYHKSQVGDVAQRLKDELYVRSDLDDNTVTFVMHNTAQVVLLI